MNDSFDFISSICAILGAVFAFVGALGVYRLKDFYSRLHAPTLITTLGLGFASLSAAFALADSWLSLGLHCAGVFVLIACINLTTPITTHWLVRAQKAQEQESNNIGHK